MFACRFNPPPAWSARGTLAPGYDAGLASRFNPPPAWSARGTFDREPTAERAAVSIHPPLGRRGERASIGKRVCK